MSSRRIGTFTNLSPIQDISVNAFSELNSNEINKLTKIISNGKDGVVFGLDVLNPNFKNDSIQSFNVIKSGNTYDSTKWEFDTDHTSVVCDSTRLQGFKIQDITKCTQQKITFKIKLSNYNIGDLIGKNILAKFTLKFHIVDGCPKKIYGYVNSDNVLIDYPRNESTEQIELSILHNFKQDSDDNINLSLLVEMDPFDVYTPTATYSGQSYLEINNIEYKFDLLNIKDFKYRITDNHNSYNYPTQYVHPAHSLDITTGVAIKDDVVIDVKGKNKEYFPAISLDLNSNQSWIKNNPFTLDDFTGDTAQQKAYIYNQTPAYSLDKGTINTTSKYLEFKVDNVVYSPSDEYEVTQNDCFLSIVITKELYKITIPEQQLTTSICGNTISGNLCKTYGSVGYIVDKRTNCIIKKIDLEYDSATKTVSAKEITITEDEIKIGWNNVDTDTIGVVISAGPVKVSGNISEVCSNNLQWANVVVYYTYFKNPKQNKAYIGLIRDSDLDAEFNEDYLILAKVRFISPNTVDLISYENRQQFYAPYNKAKNIDYGSDLTVDETKLWINIEGQPEVPTSTSDAITKLIKWLNNSINISNTRITLSILYNRYGLFRDNELVIWKWNNELNFGDLQSSGFEIDISGSTSAYLLAAWDANIKKIVKTNLHFDLNTTITTNKFLSITYDDVHNYYKIVDTELTFPGNEGEVLYSDGNGGLDPHVILYDDVYTCETTEECEECKNHGIDYKYIYNHWIKYGHQFQNGVSKQYGIDEDYSGDGPSHWYWDSENNCIRQSVNSTDNNGFVCSRDVKYMDLTVRFTSTSADDDWNGLVLLAYDKNGRQHTLTFGRCLNALYYSSNISERKTTFSYAALPYFCRLDWYVNPQESKILSSWSIQKLDIETSSERLIIQSPNDTAANFDWDVDYTSSIIDTMCVYENRVDKKTCPVCWNPVEEKYHVNYGTGMGYKDNILTYNGHNESYMCESTDDYLNPENYKNMRGWKDFPGGVILNLKYYNDEQGHRIIQCKTTKFLKEKIDSYEFIDKVINIDIDELLESETISQDNKEILKLFKDGCRWGYFNRSQASSTFENIKIITDQNLILNYETDEVWRYDGNDWVVVSDARIKDYLKKGTIYYNSILKKKYWYDLNGILSCIDADLSTKENILETVYPIGSVYISLDTRNPATIFGFGTWQKISEGRCLFGCDENNTDLGTTKDSGLPNITGSLTKISTETEPISYCDRPTNDGSLTTVSETGSSYGIKETSVDTGTAVTKITFNANNSNSIYGNSTIVQPPALMVNIWQRIADSIS